MQVLLHSFIVFCRYTLEDHLPGGEHDNPSDHKKSSVVSVPKTNTISERDFAQLDRLLRQKPNATTTSLEGMILFTNNKTAKWLNEKSEEEREVLLARARKKSPEWRKLFQHRREEMLLERSKLLREKQLNLKRKRQQAVKEKEKATAAMMEYGLWQTEDQVKENLAKFKSKTAKTKALKAQLYFRKKVLEQTYPEKSVYHYSHQGKVLTPDQLATNLCKLLPGTHSQAITQPCVQSHDLLGKRIKHRWLVDGESLWYTGTVLSLVPTTTCWYNVKYDEEEDILTLDLQEDLKNGDLEIIS